MLIHFLFHLICCFCFSDYHQSQFIYRCLDCRGLWDPLGSILEALGLQNPPISGLYCETDFALELRCDAWSQFHAGMTTGTRQSLGLGPLNNTTIQPIRQSTVGQPRALETMHFVAFGTVVDTQL